MRWLFTITLFCAAVGCRRKDDAVPALSPGEGPPKVAPNATLDEKLDAISKEFLSTLQPAGPAFHGELLESQRQDFQAVLQAGRCYKILSVGPNGTDLDMFLFDPDGIQIEQDTGSDEYPILGYAHAICPPVSGAYRVQVLMSNGEGEFRSRVYQST